MSVDAVLVKPLSLTSTLAHVAEWSEQCVRLEQEGSWVQLPSGSWIFSEFPMDAISTNVYV